MASEPRSRPRSPKQGRPPIRWTGVLFGLLLNILVVSLGLLLLEQLGVAGTLGALLLLLAAALVGVLTAVYVVGERAGIHLFLAGILSIPVIGLVVVAGNWGFAILVGSCCAMGGLLTERLRRRA